MTDLNQKTSHPKRRRTHKERTDLSESKMFEAAQTLILEVGTQRTTLKEVGERAGYSRGLANSRFGNKENLFLKLTERYKDIWLEEVKKASEGLVGLEALLSRFDAASEYARKFPNDAQVLYILWFESVGASSEIRDGLSSFHQTANKDVEKRLNEAISLGEISAHTNVKTFSLMFTSMLFGLSYQYVTNPTSIDFPTIAKSFKQQVDTMFSALKD